MHGTRTWDLSFMKRVCYQLTYSSEWKTKKKIMTLFDLLFNKRMLVWHTPSTLFNTHYHTLLNTLSWTVWPTPTTMHDQLWRHDGPTMFVNLTPAFVCFWVNKCVIFATDTDALSFISIGIVDSLMIYFNFSLDGWIIKHSLIPDFASNYEHIWQLVTLNSFPYLQ